jgi:hypothetical protein
VNAFQRAVTFLTLGLLTTESAGLLAQTLDASHEDSAVPAPPAVLLPEAADARFLRVLRSKIPIDPIESRGDPYLIWQNQPPPAAPAGTVCGVKFEQDQVHYHLTTFGSVAAARSAGFAATHLGACGTCSTLQDLAVYLEKPDLTTPVRRCGISWDASASLTCLDGLGFSAACAQTWQYNLRNTRRHCATVCIWSWIKGEAPTRKDGQLNTCLQCDEDRSGPVFKATAGRTRRNSGIHSSIPRPNDEIAPIIHDYVPDLAPR